MRGEDYMRSRMPHQIEIDWIRHGKTLANEKKMLSGPHAGGVVRERQAGDL